MGITQNKYWYEGDKPAYGYEESEDVFAKIVGKGEDSKYFLKFPGKNERQVERDNRLLNDVLLTGEGSTEEAYNQA